MRMRIRVILPVSHNRLNEVSLREATRYSSSQTDISVATLAYGPQSVEGSYEEAMAVPGILECAQQAEQDGCDAIIMDCFGDPGVTAARELLDIPVIGPAEASFLLASSLGRRFSVVTVLESVVPLIEHLVIAAGLPSRLASIRNIDMPVLSLCDKETMKRALRAEMLLAIRQDHAHVLILGCTGMTDVAEELQAELLAEGYDVPVISPIGAAVRLAETMVALRLKQSRLTYTRPKDCHISLRESRPLAGTTA
jgi:allantoin racemase